MFKRLIELALSKARTEAERAALEPVLVLASALDECESGFAARINASKVARGEGPTKLSKRKRQEVDQYALDARELENEQYESFSRLDDPAPIIHALLAGLNQDVQFWSQAMRHAHPSDREIVQDFVQSKTRLRDALTSWFKQFADMDDDD